MKNREDYLKFFGLLLIAIFLFLSSPFFKITENNEVIRIHKIAETIQNNYVEEVDTLTLYEGMLDGIVNALDDPHSEYFTAKEGEKFKESLSSSFVGIGVAVVPVGDYIMVNDVFAESPAEAAGIKKGDIITEVNGEDIGGQDVDTVISNIKGPEGSYVTITVETNGESRKLDMTRENIITPTVESEIIQENNKNVGYIKILSFSEKTAEEFNIALADLETQGIDGLIVDVRNNGGGYLGALVEIANNIIPSGEPYLITKNNKGRDTEFESNGEKKPYPIVGLQNENTASASEILMGALKENNNSEIVGTTSYGKGSVQKTIPVLLTGGFIKLTVENWYTSSMEPINEVGIEPTIEIESLIEENFLDIEKANYAYGEANFEIQKAKIMLNDLGYDIDIQNNNFSKSLENAIKDLQTKYKLEATGEIDKDTASLINLLYYHNNVDEYDDVQLNKAIEVIINNEVS